MSWASERSLELQERGFDEVEGWLCLEHVADPALLDLVAQDGGAGSCAVCQRDDRPRTSLEELTSVVVETLRYWYSDPVDELPWDGAEGGYEGPVVDTSDVVGEVCGEAFQSDASDWIMQRLVEVISIDKWTVWGGGFDLDSLEWQWSYFADDVEHVARYVFSGPRESRQHDAPRRVGLFLDKVLVYATERLGLLRREDAGLAVFRGRLVDDPSKLKPVARDLGPPPPESASANRLSAAGISFLYASEDIETVVAEIAGHGVAPYAVVGKFVSNRALNILDLTGPPAAGGSLFDPQLRETRRMRAFLRSFVGHVTRPVIPDGRQHVEYAPTQVLTEFFRWMAPNPIDGIALPSAQTGKRTFVFFCNASEVDDEITKKERAVFTLSSGSAKVYTVIRSYSSELSPIGLSAPGT